MNPEGRWPTATGRGAGAPSDWPRLRPRPAPETPPRIQAPGQDLPGTHFKGSQEA